MYVLQGYQDGGCDPGKEIGGVSCTVTRSETTLDAVLDQLCRFYQERYGLSRGDRENVIRFLFKMDIQDLGFFDMVLTCQGENVDLQIFGPPAVTSFAGMVQGEMTRILSENGLKPSGVQVQTMDRPLEISAVFPKIFEGENSINVSA